MCSRSKEAQANCKVYHRSPIPICQPGWDSYYDKMSSSPVAPSSSAMTAEQREVEKLRVRSIYEQRSRERKVRMYQEALEEAIRRETINAGRQVTFDIHHDTQFGQNLYVSGSIDSLGNWQSGKAVPMKWKSGNSWTVTVSIPQAVKSFEYKYVIIEGGVVHWEPGTNHKFKLPSPKDRQKILLIDQWGVSW